MWPGGHEVQFAETASLLCVHQLFSRPRNDGSLVHWVCPCIQNKFHSFTRIYKIHSNGSRAIDIILSIQTITCTSYYSASQKKSHVLHIAWMPVEIFDIWFGHGPTNKEQIPNGPVCEIYVDGWSFEPIQSVFVLLQTCTIYLYVGTLINKISPSIINKWSFYINLSYFMSIYVWFSSVFCFCFPNSFCML